jgi:polar amino acid transport system substrate-binding protein
MDTSSLRRRQLLAGSWALGGLAPAHAGPGGVEPPRLVCGELPPLTSARALGGRVGLLAGAAGHRQAAEVMPWQRAWREALLLGNTLMFPVARTPGREAQWHWLTPLTCEQAVLVVDRALWPRPTRPLAFADLRQHRVGVLRDCVLHDHLRSQGFTAIEPASHDRINAAKLAMGRVQAWLGFQSVVNHWLPAQSAASSPWLRLPGPEWPIYLAGTRDIPLEALAPWQLALARAVRLTAPLVRHEVGVDRSTRHHPAGRA